MQKASLPSCSASPPSNPLGIAVVLLVQFRSSWSFLKKAPAAQTLFCEGAGLLLESWSGMTGCAPRLTTRKPKSHDFGWREFLNPIAELRVAPHILRVDEIRLLLSQDVVLARRRAWVFPARRAQRLVVGVWDPNSK